MKLWYFIPAKWAHQLAPFGLRFYSTLFGKKLIPKWRSIQWRHLNFNNPIGIAGGVDKDGHDLQHWWRLGCGFVEIGTITPQPQKPNPGNIIDRNLKERSLWNKMGFPSQGSKQVLKKLNSINKRTPLFINVGKNRQTSNERASLDYVSVMRDFQNIADAYVINISSPNTTGLRDLLRKENLRNFLEPLITCAHNELKKPALLKLSPDMSQEQLFTTLDLCIDLDVDGLILTNTTLWRPQNSTYPVEGGLSGAPLAELSKKMLIDTVKYLKEKQKKLLLISVGGLLNKKDIEERLHLGADLVQIYTGLIINGPDFILRVCENE